MDESTIGKLQACLQLVDEQDTILNRIVLTRSVFPGTVSRIQDRLAVVQETLAHIIEEVSDEGTGL